MSLRSDLDRMPYFKPSLLIVLTLACTLFPLNSPVCANDEGFTEDAAAAVKQAKSSDKALFILFTGSDWCPPCKRLEAEVLSQEKFLDSASENFVLLKLDFPKSTPQDPELVEQNKTWAEKFGVNSFPTVIMVDADLKPFAFAGYEEGGPENYLQTLDQALQTRQFRDKTLAAAAKAEGNERANLLDQALTELGEEVANVYYADLIEEIVALDKNNELGLRSKWNAARDAEMRKVIMTDLVMMARFDKPESAIRLIDEVLGEIDFTAAETLTILQLKLNIARELKDPERVDAVLDQMITLNGVEGETRERLIAKKVYLMVGSGRRDEAMNLLDKALVGNQNAAHLLYAKGQLLAAEDEHQAAVEAFTAGLDSVVANPDLKIDLVSGKSDSLFALDQAEAALKLLDDFADDSNQPSELRAEALLHKAMLMYDMGRSRQARLTENRAVEVTESPAEKASIQKMVELLRKKYEQ